MTIKPYSDWLKELDAIKRKNDDDGLSSWELAELWKCEIKLARKRIREGISKGAFTLGKKMITKIDGIRQPITVYCYKGKKK